MKFSSALIAAVAVTSVDAFGSFGKKAAPAPAAPAKKASPFDVFAKKAAPAPAAPAKKASPFAAFGKKPEPVKAAPAKKASPFAAFRKKPEPVKAAPAKKAAPAFSAPKIELPNPFPKSDVKKVFDGTVKKGPRVATRVFNLDLFAPDKQINDYGQRGRKGLKVGQIAAGKSYVPAGMTAAEYNKVRASAQAKKDANYQRNIAKAGVFDDYTDFYTKRGTDTKGDWYNSVTGGHEMVKTKYDWSGDGETRFIK